MVLVAVLWHLFRQHQLCPFCNSSSNSRCSEVKALCSCLLFHVLITEMFSETCYSETCLITPVFVTPVIGCDCRHTSPVFQCVQIVGRGLSGFPFFFLSFPQNLFVSGSDVCKGMCFAWPVGVRFPYIPECISWEGCRDTGT